ncbi:MAG: uroporphyrinogen decarboxylase family protein [Thermacetogeniaceae bacterium]
MSHTDELTSKERVFRAIRHEEIDRIPIFGNLNAAAPQLIGRKLNLEYFTDGEALAAGALAAWEQIGGDIIAVGSPSLSNALGADLIWPDNDWPTFNKPVITSHADADRLQALAPDQDKFLQASLQAIRIVKQKVGDRVPISSGGGCIFNAVADLIGTERLLLSTRRDPELVHKVARVVTETAITHGKLAVEAGADLLGIGGAVSGPACMSPKTYVEIALPYLTEQTRAYHEAGAFVSHHPCGEEYPYVDILDRTGTDILHFTELFDLAIAQKIFVGRIAVSGGIDPSNILFLGTPEEVEEHIKRVIESLPYQTGAILQPGCGLSPNFPLENLKAMIEAARKYGSYAGWQAHKVKCA